MMGMSSAFASSALFADQHCAKRMPFSMPEMSMMVMATAASILVRETGVFTPVSFVAFALVLIGLLLSLSGLTGLGGLVGLIPELKASALQGD